MASTRFMTELTMAGFVYFLGIFFLCLRVLCIGDLSFLNHIRDFLPYVVAVLLIVSYVLGMMAVVIILAFQLPFSWIGLATWPPEDRQKRAALDVRIADELAPPIQKRLNFEYGTWILFRHLAASTFLFTLSFSWWLSQMECSFYVLAVIVTTGLSLTALFIWTYLRQGTTFRTYRDAADEQVEARQRAELPGKLDIQ